LPSWSLITTEPDLRNTKENGLFVTGMEKLFVQAGTARKNYSRK
jgi:hypothetical protein